MHRNLIIFNSSTTVKTNPKAKSLDQIGGMARQGDTLLRRIESIPAGLKRLNVTPTLALGEKTGHHHSFVDGGAIAFADDDQARLADAVEVTAPQAPLTHQEHGVIVYPKGCYDSPKQVEDTGAEIVPVTD